MEEKKKNLPWPLFGSLGWQNNSRSLHLITFQQNFCDHFTSYIRLLFVKADVGTPTVYASLCQPWQGSRWVTGIDLRAAEERVGQGARRADVF